VQWEIVPEGSITMSSTVHNYPPTGTICTRTPTVKRKSELRYSVHLTAHSLSMGTVVNGLDIEVHESSNLSSFV
jgi:hypothetical protein